MTVHGGEELATRLNALPPKLSRKVKRQALIAGAEPIRAEMGRLAPRGPEAPHLADSMTISTARSQEEQEEAIKVGPARDQFHGFFQEWGTRRHAAQPFARPAFSAKAPEALGIIGARLWDALRKAAGTHGPSPTPGFGQRAL